MDADGSWIPKEADGFQKLIKAARGYRDVVQAGQPTLREPAKPVDPDAIGTADIQELIEEMISVMALKGVGLAAPQLGVALQVITLQDSNADIADAEPGEAELAERAPFGLKVLINPVVKKRPGSRSAVFFEGCLSVQGYRALVERALEVDVTALGGDGRPVAFAARGWQARILQHEVDHLAGTLYVDRMIPRTFRRVPSPQAQPR